MSKIKILITGISGFTGYNLYKSLIKQNNFEIFGTFHSNSISHKNATRFQNINLSKIDLRDRSAVNALISRIKPHKIYHLAGFVSVRDSFDQPNTALEINTTGTFNVLQEVADQNLNCRILIPGSAEQYGKKKASAFPLCENSTMEPANPYALSKTMQEEIGKYFLRQHDLDVCFTRTFHYFGVNQPLGFVCSDFSHEISMSENIGKKVIRVGNLDAQRDFLSVNDVVNAYITIMEQGKKGEVYNVCSGKVISINCIVKKLLKLSILPLNIETDSNKLRPSDVPIFVGKNNKLCELGWKYSADMDYTLEKTLNYWRNLKKHN